MRWGESEKKNRKVDFHQDKKNSTEIMIDIAMKSAVFNYCIMNCWNYTSDDVAEFNDGTNHNWSQSFSQSTDRFENCKEKCFWIVCVFEIKKERKRAGWLWLCSLNASPRHDEYLFSFSFSLYQSEDSNDLFGTQNVHSFFHCLWCRALNAILWSDSLSMA